MTIKLMKVAIVLLTAVAILATAGAVSAGSPIALKLNISTGQITEECGSYEGYVYLEPATSGVPANITALRYQITTPTVKNVSVTYIQEKTPIIISGGANQVYGPNGCSISFSKNMTISSPVLLGKIKITVSNLTGINSTTRCELNFTESMTYMYAATVSSGNATEEYYGVNCTRIGYTLNGSIPNSILANNSALKVKTEDHNVSMDDKFFFFSEFTQKLTGDNLSAVNPSVTFVNYTSKDESILKFYDNATAKKQNYVVLTGSKYVYLVANLTNKTSGAVLQTLPIFMQTLKANITQLDDPKGAFFNYTNATYKYTGSSMADVVTAAVTKEILNHSVNTTDAYGFKRIINPLTLTFFNDSNCTSVVNPIEGGQYWFNVSMLENDNYETLTNYTIRNNTFIISGATIKPNFVFGTFNATTPARLTAYYNTTPELIGFAVFANASVPAYTFRNNPYTLNLPYNKTVPVVNITKTDVKSITDNDCKNITFVNDSILANKTVSFIQFEGRVLGDFDGNNKVNAQDSSNLLIKLSEAPDCSTLTLEQKFYCNVYGNTKISAVDARAINQYDAGVVDADYKTKST